MARVFRAVEVIDRPVTEVWAFLCDPANVPEWMAGVDEFWFPDRHDVHIGSRYRFQARGAEREGEVTGWEPCAVLALTSIQGGISATYTYQLQDERGQTRITLDAVCNATGLWRLVQPLIGFLMKRADSGQLAALREAIRNNAERPAPS